MSSRVTRPRSPGQHVHVLGRAKSYPPYPCLCVSWHLVFPPGFPSFIKTPPAFRSPFSVSYVPLRQGRRGAKRRRGYASFPFSVFRFPFFIAPYIILYNKVYSPSSRHLSPFLPLFFAFFLKNLSQPFASLRKSLTFALAKREHLLRVIMEDVFLR